MKTQNSVLAALLICLISAPTWATPIAGELVAWGLNASGQTNVPTGNDFVAIAAGSQHGLALKSNGSLVGWGDNTYGQTNVPGGSDFAAVAKGSYHGLALKSDGSLAGWGYNNNGQTNVPAGNDFAAVDGGEEHSLALKSDGTLVAWGRNSEGQTNVPAGNDFVAIAAGGFHGLALKSDGSLVAWGYNSNGQTDVPAGNNFVAIAAGAYSSLALKSDGSLVAWGSNNEGQSDVPAGNDFVAIAALQLHCLALKSDGSLVAWGFNDSGQTNVPAGNNFVAIAAGDRYSMAIREVAVVPSRQIVEGQELTASLWLNLANTDDIGTYFDVLVEAVDQNGEVFATGMLNRFKAVRTPSASESIVLTASRTVAFNVGETFSLRIKIRIDEGPGHTSGRLQVKYDAATRSSALSLDFTQGPSSYYLHESFQMNTTDNTGDNSIDVITKLASKQNSNPWVEMGTWVGTVL